VPETVIGTGRIRPSVSRGSHVALSRHLASLLYVLMRWRIEEKAAEIGRGGGVEEQSSLRAASRRDKWLIMAAVATLMFIFDGLQASAVATCRVVAISRLYL